MTVTTVPLCLHCGVRECSYDSEPPNPGYFSTCSRCFWLGGYDPQGVGNHVHEHTASRLTPVFESGTLTGWSCVGAWNGDPCDHFQPLAVRYVVREHRWPSSGWYVYDFQEAGQVDIREHGYAMTESGARELAARLNAA